MKKYIKPVIFCALLVAFFVCSKFDDASRPDWKRISPFTDVRFENESIIVEFEGVLYEVSSIEGISSRSLIKASKARFGNLWQKRIREDIAEVLVAAGAPETTSVSLELKELNTGEMVSVPNAEMTYENRRKIPRES